MTVPTIVALTGPGSAGLAHKIVDRLPVPIVDPVVAAVRQAELLVALAPRKAVGGASGGLPPNHRSDFPSRSPTA